MKNTCILLVLSFIGCIGYGAEISLEEQLKELCCREGDNVPSVKEAIDKKRELLFTTYPLNPEQHVPEIAQAQLKIHGEGYGADERITIVEFKERCNDFKNCQAEQRVRREQRTLPSLYTSAFSLACLAGNTEIVTYFIQQAGEEKDRLINPPTTQDRPLANAICSGKPELVKYLLKNQADCSGKPFPDLTYPQYAGRFTSTTEGPKIIQAIYTNPKKWDQKVYRSIHRMVIQAAIADSNKKKMV